MKPRVLLIGGPSHTGKSTLARVVAEHLGWPHQSTDRLGRHPGRPWGAVRPWVADHYLGLTDDVLLAAYQAHYARMWPLLRRLISHHSHDPIAGPLVLEGSGLRPEYISQWADAQWAEAGLAGNGIAALWLTAPDSLITQRIYDSAAYARASSVQRALVDRFLMRTLADRTLTETVARNLGFTVIDVARTGGQEDLLGTCIRELAVQPSG